MTPTARRRAVGTLEGDAPAFLRQIAGRPSTNSDTSHLRAWYTVVIDGVRLGDMPRSAIETKHANEAIAQWQTAPSTHAVRKVRVGGYAREASTVAAHAHPKVRTGVKAYTHPGFTASTYTRVAPATSGATRRRPRWCTIDSHG